MTVRLRTLPKPVIILLGACIGFLAVVFLASPSLHFLTNHVASGRVVQSNPTNFQVLIDDKFYMIDNDCGIEALFFSCELEEGQTKTVLISSPDNEGHRFDQEMQSIGLGMLGILFFASLLVEVRFRNKKTLA